MFDNMIKQLELQTLSKNTTDFFITQEQYESFCKECIFEQLKGIKVGKAFCVKYNIRNNILEMFGDEAAKHHIQKFYVQ